MSKKLIIAATLAFNSLSVPYALAADSTTPATATPAEKTTSTNETNSDKNTSEVTKDAWLQAMEPMLPNLICKGFMSDSDLKKRFDELKITYEQCVAMIPESEKKCRDKFYSKMPANIDTKSAGTWGKSLGECIGRDFAEKNLVPKS